VPVELTQPLLVESVPDIHVSIGATGGECVVFAVETDRVHWKNVFDSFVLHSVALERVFLLLGLVTRVKVFHSHAPLDRTQHVSLFIWEAFDGSGLKLEARLPALLHDAHVAQVPDHDAPVGSAHHQPLRTQRHRVHTLRLVVRRNAFVLPCIPQFDIVIPTAGDEEAQFLAVLHALDRRFVETQGCDVVRVEIVPVKLSVESAGEPVRGVGEATIQDGCALIECGSERVIGHVVKPEVRVP